VIAPGFVPMSPRDGAFFFNFRADRARQMARALADPAFNAFARPGHEAVPLATMTSYDASFPYPVAFAHVNLSGLMADALARRGARCLRLSETEKYAHVTYFFNGGVEKPWPGEERILVQSPRVATYDLKPEMSAYEVTDRFVAALGSGVHDAIIVNYPNADMVGHTGDLQATIAAVEAVDLCLGRVSKACAEAAVGLFITADHGNAELMIDPVTGEPHTAHTTNPVPFIAAAPGIAAGLRAGGRLADVAPTLLDYLYPGDGLTAEMTGRPLGS